ncbi:hypothetical protein JXA85_01150 [Candidatus Woesearchaeota archaeon]|nr:hypothetical protein [Candidatus Woesearchaeota archaeon]
METRSDINISALLQMFMIVIICWVVGLVYIIGVDLQCDRKYDCGELQPAIIAAGAAAAVAIIWLLVYGWWNEERAARRAGWQAVAVLLGTLTVFFTLGRICDDCHRFNPFIGISFATLLVLVWLTKIVKDVADERRERLSLITPAPVGGGRRTAAPAPPAGGGRRTARP